jgi:hypothetical protein
MGLDRNSQAALDRFNRAKAARERGQDRGLQIPVAAVRVRLAKDVDLSKADPSCKRCLGTGSLGTKVIPGNRGCEPTRIPLVCRCVARGGGVRPDRIDRAAAEP